jgi:hypothetical protein
LLGLEVQTHRLADQTLELDVGVVAERRQFQAISRPSCEAWRDTPTYRHNDPFVYEITSRAQGAISAAY